MKKNSNLIIIVVIIFVIAFGIYYFASNKSQPTSVVQNATTTVATSTVLGKANPLASVASSTKNSTLTALKPDRTFIGLLPRYELQSYQLIPAFTLNALEFQFDQRQEAVTSALYRFDGLQFSMNEKGGQ